VGEPSIKGTSVKGGAYTGDFFKEAKGCFPLRIEHHVEIYQDASGARIGKPVTNDLCYPYKEGERFPVGFDAIAISPLKIEDFQQLNVYASEWM
jgi:hypothetical protein